MKRVVKINGNFLYKVYRYFFLFVFFFIILFPITRIDHNDYSEQEQRKLSVRTRLFVDGNINNNYCKDFDSWLSDRFRYRQVLIDWYTQINNIILGKLENDKAVQGEDGFLFYKLDKSVNNYENRTLFTDIELEKIKDNIIFRQQLLASRGIQYYVMIAPDKNRIYGENFPRKFKKINSYGRAEQLVNYLKKIGITVIYPMQQLIDAKATGVIYYRLDTHWNTYGAFWGYFAIMQEVAKNDQSVQYLTINDFNQNIIRESNGDLLQMLNVKVEDVNIPKNEILSLKPKADYSYEYIKNAGREGVETQNTRPLNNKRLVMLRDSFTSAMEPYFSQTFAHNIYIWSPNFNENYDYIINDNPDIVIQEMVERAIPDLLIDTPELNVTN